MLNSVLYNTFLVSPVESCREILSQHALCSKQENTHDRSPVKLTSFTSSDCGRKLEDSAVTYTLIIPIILSLLAVGIYTNSF